jgi:exonuclease SbcD
MRVLLFSDLQLDRPYEWASPAIAESRRAAAREALVEILTEARRHSVGAIACAGDLFNRHTVKPADMQWLMTAFRSAGIPVLIAPGDQDYVGPLGGYIRHEWPDNVTIFDNHELTPIEIVDGVTIWGGAHTEAHRVRSFLDRFEVDRSGVNLALFHGSEIGGQAREPELDPCATFAEADVERAGFDHALVGHYRQSHFGRLHTYPGAPLAHDFGSGSSGGAMILTLKHDGSIERDYLPVSSPDLHEIDVDVTGARSKKDVVRRAKASVGDQSGILRLRLTGLLSPDIAPRHEDFIELAESPNHVMVVWNVQVDVDLDQLASEPTIRGQFVRDVLSSAVPSEERRQRVLLIGLRALAGHDELEGLR